MRGDVPRRRDLRRVIAIREHLAVGAIALVDRARRVDRKALNRASERVLILRLDEQMNVIVLE